MINYYQTELQRCYNLFALCYAKEAPVPPAWIAYHDALKLWAFSSEFDPPIRPATEEYPCRWIDAWRGLKTLVKMDLATAVTRYISTLPSDEQILARVEIERSRWWFETNSYFVKMCELFHWDDSEVDYFFETAKQIRRDD